MTLPRVPTLAGFTDFIRTNMAIGIDVLPVDSPWIEFSYDVSIEIVNLQINQASPPLYVQAVYNLGGDNLINFAQDVPPSTYFTDLRAKWKVNDFVPGVVSASSDESTSVTLEVIQGAAQFKLADLQNLKTPWGRQYLAIAQRVGTLWGLS